jgi:hypothetical protein
VGLNGSATNRNRGLGYSSSYAYLLDDENMNYLPSVSWGMYGGTTATETANYFASWGLMDALPLDSGVIPSIPSVTIYSSMYMNMSMLA